MSLYEQLQKATSEEDVKDIYIKALGLKSYQKGLIDIQTKEVWFEAKPGGKVSSYSMFTQLLYYVNEWLKHGEQVPPLLAVIDCEKAAIMKTEHALPLLEKKIIKWGKSASDVTPEALEVVSTHIGTHLVSFRIKTHEKEFIDTVKNAVKHGDIIRTQIIPANLKQVFDKWVDMIGKEIHDVSPDDYALLFFADVMSDGTVSTHRDLPAQLLHKDSAPVFALNGKLYELSNKEGYRQFWAIYHRPPKVEYRDYLLERRDSLIPLDERSFKGAFYTPLHVVDKAYDKLTETLGDNWQEEYVVWDMCCGVGNLEVKHSNPRNIYMSTLDQADVDVMKATKTCVAATRFQYDYLNDDITDGGKIDYSLTNKVPENLRKAIRSGKKILVLINPPYAEATSGLSSEDYTHKDEVSKNTKVAEHLFTGDGMGSRELFVQFLARIAREFPNATIAMFSKLKYVNAPNFEKFRQTWDAEYLGGFIVPSKSFEGLKGEFPIGFLIWQTSHGDGVLSQITEITTDVLDKDARPIGEKKFYNLPNESFLNEWIERPKSNGIPCIALKNAITPYTGKLLRSSTCDDAIGFLVCKGNDLQNAGQSTFLLSSIYGSVGGLYITPENFEKASIVFTVRKIVKHTWQNDRDQFLRPTGELPDEFKNDCLVWMLFNGSNLTASANDLEWGGKKWSIVNHFIPYTESEVGSPERFESDFMVRYMADKTFSPEAHAVLYAGKVFWKAYYEHAAPHTVRDELKLNRADVGWYQIRNTLKARNTSGDSATVNFKPFEEAYRALTDKLQPKVYSLGFLKV